MRKKERKKEMIKMTNYKFSITLKKFCIVAVEVLIAGIVATYAHSQWYMLIAPLLEAVRNFVEHIKK
jgi:hypothetical protein